MCVCVCVFGALDLLLKINFITWYDIWYIWYVLNTCTDDFCRRCLFVEIIPGLKWSEWQSLISFGGIRGISCLIGNICRLEILVLLWYTWISYRMKFKLYACSVLNERVWNQWNIIEEILFTVWLHEDYSHINILSCTCNEYNFNHCIIKRYWKLLRSFFYQHIFYSKTYYSQFDFTQIIVTRYLYRVLAKT